MADNWNGDPLYELARQGATPAQLKWAETQMQQGKPYVDGSGRPLTGAGWSTNMPYMPMSGAPAPGKQDRYRPVRDPQTLQPMTLGNAQYPSGNRLTPNAVGYTQQGTMTGANPAVTAIDSAAQPGRQVVPYTLPNTSFASLTSSTPPNYGNYTATMRMANPNPLIPGPAYVPQPVAGDPWGGMRMSGQAAAPMPGYGAAPGAAPAQPQAGGLFNALFGGGNGLAKMFMDSGMGTGGLFGVPSAPMSPEAISALRKSPDYSAEQIKALEQNKAMYSPKAGAFAPTKAPGGKARRTYGDSSATGSGGSLVGR